MMLGSWRGMGKRFPADAHDAGFLAVWIAKTMFPGDAHDAGLSAVEWKMVFSSCS